MSVVIIVVSSTGARRAAARHRNQARVCALGGSIAAA